MNTRIMNQTGSKVNEWVERAANGDEAARQQLLGFYRPNLRRIVAGQLDKRLAARVDPSDIVQEIMLDADRKLVKFLQQPTVPLLVWLRKIASERVIDTHRRHLGSQRRSVIRERRESPLWDGSAPDLMEMIANSMTTPSGELMREEQSERVRAAVDRLPARYREVLVMRHFDQMEPDEIAQVLGISPGAVRARILRALLRLRETLETLP
jgi:RNA polymerase sigma-70 factor (ECF subfamily)